MLLVALAGHCTRRTRGRRRRFGLVRGLALGYIALAVVIFVLCVVCLVDSYRQRATRAERNQVQVDPAGRRCSPRS